MGGLSAQRSRDEKKQLLLCLGKEHAGDVLRTLVELSTPLSRLGPSAGSPPAIAPDGDGTPGGSPRRAHSAPASAGPARPSSRGWLHEPACSPPCEGVDVHAYGGAPSAWNPSACRRRWAGRSSSSALRFCFAFTSPLCTAVPSRPPAALRDLAQAAVFPFGE